MSITDPVIRV